MSGQVNKDPCLSPLLRNLSCKYLCSLQFFIALYSRLFKNSCGYSYSIRGILHENSILQFCVNLSDMYTVDFNNLE